MKKIIVICGPTTSGKTELAHLMAETHDGEIVNADSMQLYKGLSTLNASPSEELKAKLPYHLYNFLDLNANFNVMKYAYLAEKKIKEITNRGNLPILVGGTGMYINALIQGFSKMPNIDSDLRQAIRTIQASVSSTNYFDLLKNLDPLSATTLNMHDKQRISRALEIFLQTGSSIIIHQKKNIKLLSDFNFQIIALMPERNFLYSNCNSRLEKIFEDSVKEVKTALEFLSNGSLASKTIGVEEIIAYINGDITKNNAIEKIKLKTRHYAKRQVTWIRNQIEFKTMIEFANKEEYREKIKNLVSPPGLEPGTP